MADRGALDDGDNERLAKYEARWSRGGITFMSVYNNRALDNAANDTAANFVRDKIAEIVTDSGTAKLLQPNNHPIGTKRICIDSDYFAAFNRPNVTLVDIKSDPIEEITANAVRTRGKTYEIDALVLATGFAVLAATRGRLIGSPAEILGLIVAFVVAGAFDMSLELHRPKFTFTPADPVPIVGFFVVGPLGLPVPFAPAGARSVPGVGGTAPWGAGNEPVWNDCQGEPTIASCQTDTANNEGGGGGGLSVVNTRPAWQPASTDGMYSRGMRPPLTLLTNS